MTQEQLPLIDFVKLQLRLKSDVFDEEVQSLIDAALEDMNQSGITNLKETAPLVRRAVSLYCKAEFGLDALNAQHFKQSYESIRDKLTLVGDYNGME